MDNNAQILQQLAESSRKQVHLARIQCIFAVLSALFCLLLLVSICLILPRIQKLTGQVSDLAVQAETVLTNLESVTNELAQADIGGMVSNVDSLVKTSQNGLQQALDKVNAIDIESLNRAIEDLAQVVAPLANLIQTLDSLPFM